ncbi:glutathione S-transferase family protein [Pelagibaculum spongiae]|uniref:GST N-terminal domain-containing protein n=1 Tax=Pelagibaculum spongiae TaxID=2080658 RepID=A0A2V1GUV9_9GAMM|nr:glutathione S-transferase [Pelagibaculum spongiae]PVZ69471.1 hypothetical protein DC094_09035 [Pelagibaculum spongiae]
MNHLNTIFTLNGWIVSPYTQKTLSYLRFKGIPHREKAPSALELIGKVKKNVGRPVMPTMVTPEGEWWQDSSEIIDKLELQFREKPVVPPTPKQKLAAYLLELHGDEWLILSALHYRWTEPKSDQFIVSEFGRLAAPWLPKFINRLIGARIKKMMMQYMPRFGINGSAGQGVRNYTTQLIENLELHFQQHPYLLGNRPCVGDFAIFGSMYAHLYRDPGSKPLFDNAPNLVLWINRMLDPGQHLIQTSTFLENDQIPETLTPIFKVFFAEQFPYIQQLMQSIDQYLQANPTANRLPRVIGESSFTIGNIASKRQQFTFSQWKLQRALEGYQSLSDTDKAPVDAWLRLVNGEGFKQMNIKRQVIRRDFKEVLA